MKNAEIWAEIWLKYGKVAEKSPKGAPGRGSGTVLTGQNHRVKLRSKPPGKGLCRAEGGKS